MINTDTNTDSNGRMRNSTRTSTLPAGGVMQNLGLWGHVSHLLQKQPVFLVVKSYKMRVSGGVAYTYIYICVFVYLFICISTQTSSPVIKGAASGHQQLTPG